MKKFAVATTVHQTNTAWNKQTQICRLVLGVYDADSKEEAVGNFVLNCQTNNDGFTIGEILTVEIMPPTQTAA